MYCPEALTETYFISNNDDEKKRYTTPNHTDILLYCNGVSVSANT